MDITRINNNTLFKGMNIDEIESCLTALSAEIKEYKKEMIIFHMGDVTSKLGIVLSGSVTIESSDIWGNCSILSHIDKDGFFAETYALLQKEVMLVDVRANENCEILFLSTSGLFSYTHPENSWHSKFITNLLIISSHKNLTLSRRSLHTAAKTIRGRVLTYLNTVSLQKNSNEFDIPFDRQQLADYLNVERTALSKELGKMRSDGIIEYHKNHFILFG